MSEPLQFTRTLPAPPDLVFRALTQPPLLKQWMCSDCKVDGRLGGTYFLTWNDGYFTVGEFTAWEAGKHLAYSWRGRNEPDVTQVEITLSADGGGTRIEVSHSGLGSGEAWDQARQGLEMGWKSGLDDLRYMLETGLDLRFMSRPMLGVFTGFLDEPTIKRLGVASNEGVLLSGVVEGSGAHAAGLQSDDLLLALGGAALTNFNSLSVAMSKHKGGDTVTVEFLRGGEKHSVAMTLSKRPLPDIPPTPSALAEVLRDIHAQINQEFDQMLDGVPEEALAYHPAEGEWNVREVLAHLIFSERHSHLTVWGSAGGDDAVPWPDNTILQLAPLLAAYPTAAELRAEFRRALAGSVALAELLPPALVQSRGNYTQIAQMLTGSVQHIRSHYDQIQQAIAAAQPTT